MVLGAAVTIAGAMVACQGSFDAPRLNNPRDPANGQLPPTPSVNAQAQPCAGPPPTVRITWTLADPTGVIGFQIYRAKANEDPGILIASVDASQRQITDGNLAGIPQLDERTIYSYRVRALAGGGIPGFRSTPDTTTTADCF